jgi:hypothetical protein
MDGDKMLMTQRELQRWYPMKMTKVGKTLLSYRTPRGSFPPLSADKQAQCGGPQK